MNRDSKPALLLLGSQMAVGGAQHLLLAQARWFQEHGYRVSAAFFYDKEGLREHWSSEYGIEIIDLKAWRADAGLPSNLMRLCAGFGRLFRLMRQRGFYAVETFTHHANLLGLPVAFAAGMPIRVGSHHGVPAMSPGLNRLHSLLINSRITSSLVTVSKHLRDEAVIREGIRPEKLTIISNGVAVTGVRPSHESTAMLVRDELGVGAVSRLIVNVGRLIPEKGQALLIEAMPLVLKRHPEARAVIVGDGPLRKALQRRVEQLQLNRAVLLLGTRPDVHRLLQAAELFAYPSIRDGRPLALLEAMSEGVPVVASNCEAITDLLEHKKTALLCRAGDSGALAETLINALATPKEMQELARAAAQQVAREFSVETMCRQYDALFRGS